MGHDKKEKLPKGLYPHKTGKSHGSADKCDSCDTYTKYNGVCAICQLYANEDERLKYEGIYKPYESLL
jgi:hypothetical protein